MTRDTAWQILNRHLTNPTLIKHSLAAEAAMRAFALHFGEDPDEWGITGLLHDADYEKAKGHPEKHGLLISQLEPNTIPSVIEHAIQAHNFEFTKILPSSHMDWALFSCDELTGIIFEEALHTKGKSLMSITPQIILERVQKGKFAKGPIHDKIIRCEEKLEISLQDFVSLTLSAMRQIAPILDTKAKEK